MSHCSFLYSSETDDPNDDKSRSEVVEVCKARIPLIWLAMYKAVDIIANDYNDDDDIEEYLLFCTTKDAALSNLESRMKSLKKLVPSKFHNHITCFINMLKSSSKKYINVSIEDIETMSSESMLESAEEWKKILTGLGSEIDNIRTGIKRIFLGSGIPSSWDVLISSSAMSYTELKSLKDEDQWILSGAIEADEMNEWGI